MPHQRCVWCVICNRHNIFALIWFALHACNKHITYNEQVGPIWLCACTKVSQQSPNSFGIWTKDKTTSKWHTWNRTIPLTTHSYSHRTVLTALFFYLLSTMDSSILNQEQAIEKIENLSVPCMCFCVYVCVCA